MNPSANKSLVVDFIEAMRVSDTDRLETLLTEDFSWWILGKPEYLATAGEHDREFFLQFFQGTSLFPEGAQFAVTSMVAENDRVAAEAEFTAKTADGRIYDNRYHFLFVVAGGKVQRLKEYMDTHHAKVTFGL